MEPDTAARDGRVPAVLDRTPKSGPDPATDAPRARIPERTIVLVGMMGVGKSSVGQRLARRIGRAFFDADREIEIAAQATIAEIFATQGEAAFRAGERRVIARLLAGPPHVLATGGGAFMDPSTRALIGANAVAIWLRADLETLVRRTARRKNRPLLNQGDPRETQAALMALRHPIYAEAHLAVESRPSSADETTELVLEALDRYVASARLAAGTEGSAPDAG